MFHHNVQVTLEIIVDTEQNDESAAKMEAQRAIARTMQQHPGWSHVIKSEVVCTRGANGENFGPFGM